MINFDTMMLACAVHEIEERALGARVERITQPAAHATQWTLYAHGAKVTLLIVTSSDDSRMHLTRRGRSSPPTPSGFCMLLRKHLSGARLETMDRPLGLGERMVRMVFSGMDGRSYQYYAELMGRHGNQILVNDNNYVLGSIKRVTQEMSRTREVRAGISYAAPPSPAVTRTDIFMASSDDDIPYLAFENETAAAKWAQQAFSGLGPPMAREGVARRPDPQLTARSVRDGLLRLVGHVNTGSYSPVLLTDSLGRITGAYPVPLQSLTLAQQPAAQSFGGAVDDAADALEQRGAFDTEKAALLGALRRALLSLEKEQLDVDEGLANADRAASYRISGELILAHQYSIAPGATEAAFPDYETGERIVIELDPTVTPLKNAERYFSKYKKAQSSRERLEARSAQIQERARRVQDALPVAEALAGLDAVEALRERLSDLPEMSSRGGAPGAVSGAGTQAPAAYPGFKIRTYNSPDGWEILVGENAESNDHLTTRIAAPSDIWLHARSQVSAHAVIRSRNRPEAVSASAIRFAAEQVARRSMAKHSRLVPVDYTLRKYVRKPRGANAGAALYSREKTIDVTTDDKEDQ